MKSGQPYSENDLVRRIARGDRKAEFVLYKRYVDAMYHVVLRMVGNTDDAQDIVQEGFIKVFSRIRSYRGDATIGAWIKRIMINTAINWMKKHNRVRFTETDVLMDTPDPDMDDETANSIDPSIIHNSIKQLPDGCRMVLNMYAFEGLSHKEIANDLNITESTSKTQYRRAKILLRDIINQLQYEHEL